MMHTGIILYNYCTWMRSIWGFMEQSTTLLNFLTLISKKQFLCNKKTYCTLVPRNFIHWFCTRVQYDYLLHRNCFLLINMLENGMSRVLLIENSKIEPYVILRYIAKLRLLVRNSQLDKPKMGKVLHSL